MAPRRKPMPATDLTGGLNLGKDPIYLTDKESPNLLLVRFHKGLIKKMWGQGAFASLTTERVMDIYTYKQYDADEYLICCGVDHAYQYTAGAWAKISGAGPVFTGDASNIFFTTTFNNLFHVTNGKDLVQAWDGTTWTTPAANIITQFMVPFYSRLVTFNTTEGGAAYPSRLRWSIIGASTMTGTGSGAIDILDTQGAGTGLAVLGDRLFVFKEDSIWECYYVGGTDVFKVRKIIDKIGTFAGKTIVNTGGYLCFFGSDDIYVFDGSQAVPIGSNLYPYLFETSERIINSKMLNRAVAVYDYESKNYICALPTISSDDPYLLLYYDLNGKVFSRRYKSVTSLGFYTDRAGGTTWTAAVGAWTAAAWATPWRTGALPLGMPTLLFGGSTGTMEREDKITKSDELLTWESKDFIVAHNSRFVEVRYLAKGDPFEVSYSYDGGIVWTDPKTLTPLTDELAEVVDELNDETMKFRVRIRTLQQDFELAWIEPWYIPRARPV